MLHLSKVAVGCPTAEALRLRVAARTNGGIVRITTRYRPTRHAELIGGSLYWIIKHRLVGRQEILAFAESEDRRCLIELDARLVPVHPHPRKAHQGWRYFDSPPPDFTTVGDTAMLPPKLMEELAGLALI